MTCDLNYWLEHFSPDRRSQVIHLDSGSVPVASNDLMHGTAMIVIYIYSHRYIYKVIFPVVNGVDRFGST